MLYPDGLFKVGSGWGFYCPACKMVTIREDTLKPGQPVQVFHCGQWHTMKLNRLKIASLPKVSQPKVLDPPVQVGMDGGEFDYESSV
jgi:hypothetical protein